MNLSRWQRFKIWLVVRFLWVFHRCFRKAVNKICRFFRERKYHDSDIAELHMELDELLEFFSECTWVSDPWGGRVDYVSKPAKFFETKIGDCEDYSWFACKTLKGPFKKRFMSVSWYDPELDRFRGHAVCMLQDLTDYQYYHVGNWGHLGPFYSLSALIRDMAKRQKVIPIFFALRDPNDFDLLQMESIDIPKE